MDSGLIGISMLKNKINVVVGGLLLIIFSSYSKLSYALSDVTVLNPDFEMSLKYWEREGNVQEEEITVHGGDKAALVGEGGTLKQTVYVQPNQEYMLNGMLNGVAEIGIRVSGKLYRETLDSSEGSSFFKRMANKDWLSFSIPFKTGEKTRMAVIYVKYIDKTAVVDDFSVN